MQDFISMRRRGWSRRIASLPQSGFCLLSFFGLFVTRTGRTGGPILTIYTSYDVYLPKDVPFEGFVDTPAVFEQMTEEHPHTLKVGSRQI